MKLEPSLKLEHAGDTIIDVLVAEGAWHQWLWHWHWRWPWAGPSCCPPWLGNGQEPGTTSVILTLLSRLLSVQESARSPEKNGHQRTASEELSRWLLQHLPAAGDCAVLFVQSPCSSAGPVSLLMWRAMMWTLQMMNSSWIVLWQVTTDHTKTWLQFDFKAAVHSSITFSCLMLCNKKFHYLHIFYMF